MFRLNTRRHSLQRHTLRDAVLLYRRLDVQKIRRSYQTSYDKELTGAEIDEILRDSLAGWEGLVDETGAEVRYTDRVKVVMPNPKKGQANEPEEIEVEMAGVDLFIATADPKDKQELAYAIRSASWVTHEAREQEKNASAGSSNGDGEPAPSGEKAETPAA